MVPDMGEDRQREEGISCRVERRRPPRRGRQSYLLPFLSIVTPKLLSHSAFQPCGSCFTSTTPISVRLLLYLIMDTHSKLRVMTFPREETCPCKSRIIASLVKDHGVIVHGRQEQLLGQLCESLREDVMLPKWTWPQLTVPSSC